MAIVRSCGTTHWRSRCEPGCVIGARVCRVGRTVESWLLISLTGGARRKEPTTLLTTVRRSFGARAPLSRSSLEACDISLPSPCPSPLSLSLSLFLSLVPRTRRNISEHRERALGGDSWDATRAEWSVRWWVSRAPMCARGERCRVRTSRARAHAQSRRTRTRGYVYPVVGTVDWAGRLNP